MLGSAPAINIYSLYVVQGLNYLLPLLVLPYLLRVLGPHNYGAIAFAQSLLAYGVIITDFGFNFSATRAISVARSDSAEVSRIFWTTLAAKAILLFLTALLIVVLVLCSPTLRAHGAVIGICGLNVLGSVLMPQWYFQGLERMRMMAVIQAVSRGSLLVLVFVFVHSSRDELLAAAFLSAPSLLGGLLCLMSVRRVAPLGVYRPQLRDLRDAFASSRDLFISNVATSAYVSGNGFILGLVAGDSAVALYSLANKVALAAFYFFSPVVLAVFPRASLLFSRSLDEGRAFVRRLSLPLLLAAAVISAALVAFAGPLVHLLGGSSYVLAVPVLRVMGLLPLLLSSATLLAQLIMINLGLTRSLSRVYIAMAVLSLALMPILGRRFGAFGGAVSLLTIESLGPVLMLWALWRHRYFRSNAC
jgi:PST family polysaccharide transporter